MRIDFAAPGVPGKSIPPIGRKAGALTLFSHALRHEAVLRCASKRLAIRSDGLGRAGFTLAFRKIKTFAQLPRARGRLFRSPCSRTFRALAPLPNRWQTPLTKLPALAVSYFFSILQRTRRRRFCGNEMTGFPVTT